MNITINIPDNAAADLAVAVRTHPALCWKWCFAFAPGGTQIHPTDLRAQMIVVADTASPPI